MEIDPNSARGQDRARASASGHGPALADLQAQVIIYFFFYSAGPHENLSSFGDRAISRLCHLKQTFKVNFKYVNENRKK